MGACLPARICLVFLATMCVFGVLTQSVDRAHAHQTAISTLHVEIRPDQREVDMLLGISPEDLADHLELDPNGDGFIDQSEIPVIKPTLGSYLESQLSVTNAERPCQAARGEFVDGPQRMPSVLFRLTAQCEAALETVMLENRVMLDAEGGYTHYGRIQLDEDIHTTVFNRDTPTYEVEVAAGGQRFAEQSLWEVFVQYVWQGVLHIVLGLDHVLFVICLLLAARRLRALLWVITSFTVAHSITLGSSALELFSLPAAVVEPLIALSIAWLAVELLLDKEPGKHLFALSFGFGLLHGFGFSYVLRDEVGLPTDALLPALFSFNVGVELGQIAIVCAAFPLVVWAQKKPWGRRATAVAATAVLLVAVYWFVTRLV